MCRSLAQGRHCHPPLPAAIGYHLLGICSRVLPPLLTFSFFYSVDDSAVLGYRFMAPVLHTACPPDEQGRRPNEELLQQLMAGTAEGAAGGALDPEALARLDAQDLVRPCAPEGGEAAAVDPLGRSGVARCTVPVGLCPIVMHFAAQLNQSVPGCLSYSVPFPLKVNIGYNPRSLPSWSRCACCGTPFSATAAIAMGCGVIQTPPIIFH
jgi:hypothetical protein